jgi:hypothetical protein
MFKRFCRRNKVVAAAMSALLVATAFTGPGSCTITVDEDLLNQLLGWVESFDQQFDSGYESGYGYGADVSEPGQPDEGCQAYWLDCGWGGV